MKRDTRISAQVVIRSGGTTITVTQTEEGEGMTACDLSQLFRQAMGGLGYAESNINDCIPPF